MAINFRIKTIINTSIIENGGITDGLKKLLTIIYNPNINKTTPTNKLERYSIFPKPNG